MPLHTLGQGTLLRGGARRFRGAVIAGLTVVDGAAGAAENVIVRGMVRPRHALVTPSVLAVAERSGFGLEIYMRCSD